MLPAVKIRKLKRVHGVMTVLWLLLAVPTVLWWGESVMWVALMSVWANVAGHFSGWQGARAEEAADK